MAFATLQNRITAPLPEIYHAIPVAPPPVYNTSEMIAPLMKLAEYLSPDRRARRKAAVAKANYEYRLYSSGDPRMIKDPFFLYKTRKYQDDHLKSMAYIQKLGKTAKPGFMTPAQKAHAAKMSASRPSPDEEAVLPPPEDAADENEPSDLSLLGAMESESDE